MVEFLLSKGKLSLQLHQLFTILIGRTIQGADPTAKNLAGFVPLHEVVASGNRKMAVMIFLAVSRHFQAEYRKRLPLLLERIERLPDFCMRALSFHTDPTSQYHLDMEFTWNLYSWVPLLSRFCPSDVYKIYKRGSSTHLTIIHSFPILI